MRWPWRRPARLDSAQLQAAREELARTRANEPRVARIVEAHRRKVEQNHFGPTISSALGARRRHP